MEIKINDKYKPLFQQPNNVRYYIIIGGRGSGKSFVIGTYSCIKTYEPNNRILYTRYSMTSAKISIIPEFLEKIELLNKEKDFTSTNSEVINETTKSDIVFRGIKTSSGNQTANLKSITGVTVWILDEAEELDDETKFDKINLSIRKKGIQNIVVLVLNPSNEEHWIYKRFFKKKNIPSGFNGIVDNVCYIHTSYLDNIENLDESFLNEAEVMKRDEPKNYAHTFLGEWRREDEGKLLPLESLNFAPILFKDDEYTVANIAFSDPADGGGDSLSTIFLKLKDFDGRLYIYVQKVVHSQKDIGSNVVRIIDRIKETKTEHITVEVNGVGAALKYELMREIEINDIDIVLAGIHEKGNKDSKINAFYEFVKSYFIFDENYLNDADYSLFIEHLTSYKSGEDNKHIKDAIDVCCSAAKRIKLQYADLIWRAKTE
jgi:PBSX family phage terminase large subunit